MDATEESLIFDEDDHYCRAYSPEQAALSAKFVELYTFSVSSTYRVKDERIEAYIVPSGMSAISTLFHAIIPSIVKSALERPTLLYAKELYCDLPRLFKDLSTRYNLYLEEFECDFDFNLDNFYANCNLETTVILYFESCSNPHGQMLDYLSSSLLRKISDWKAKYRNLVVIVDNTWLTGIVFNPFEYGADYVVSSLAKYYSNGRAQGGVILGYSASSSLTTERRRDTKYVEQYIRYHGLHTSRYNIKIILEEMDTLGARIALSYKVTTELIALIANNSSDIFRNICHPSYSFANTFRPFLNESEKSLNEASEKGVFKKDGPSVLTLRIKSKSGNMFRKKLKNLKYLKVQTSFGSSKSKICPWHIKTVDGYTEFRLAIGHGSDAKKIYDELLTLSS